MTERDDVEAVLAIGEPAVANALIDAELKALRKVSKANPAALTPVLRRRAILPEIVKREEGVRERRGLDVPHNTARAEICEARGDWDGCLEELRRAVEQARDSQHPAYGPGSTNLRLAEGWLRQAQARAAKARG